MVSEKCAFVQKEYRANVVFKNISYKIDKKQILFDISGNFSGGSLIGILGPSGAGKSTLLNVLSGFKCTGVTGSILVNGKDRILRDFKSLSCYITQENDLHGLLTVEENMKYAADLKLGGNITQKEKDDKIEAILKTFGLNGIRQHPTSKISGGQMKRLSICLELLSNPLVLFLDEPTTGLDSFATHQCLKYLKLLAGKGKTIICTIHQPSASLFKMFDQVYVLAKGKCLYQGQTDHLVPFLKDIGIPCSLYHNPADYVIELANGEYGEDKIEKLVSANNNGKEKSNFKEKELRVVESYVELQKKPKTSLRDNFYEFKTLMKREQLKLRRNMSLTYLRIFASIANSLAISIVYWKLGSDASLIWFNYNLILAIVANTVLAGTMLTILVFPTEMHILRKENFNGYYSLKNFYMAITLIDLPLSVMSTTIGNFLVYWLTDQPMETNRIYMFTALSVLLGIVAQSVGLLIGASLNLKNGIFVGSYIHVPIMLLSGFGMVFRDIPVYFYWLSYGSYLRYGVMGMVTTIFGYNRDKLKCPNADYCHYLYGDKFLKDMGIDEGNFWVNFMALCYFYIALRVASYLSMRRTLNNQA